MREAKAETTKVQAAIANITMKVEGLRATNTALRNRAGLALEGAPVATPPMPPAEAKRPGIIRGKSKDAMQMQVMELMDHQDALEKEVKALEQENHHLKKRVEEQEDEAILLAEVQGGTDSFTQSAELIAASGKALAYRGAAREPAREVMISAPPPTGKRSSGAGLLAGKRQSDKRQSDKRQSDKRLSDKRLSSSGPPPGGAKLEPPAPELEMTSRLTNLNTQTGVPATVSAKSPSGAPAAPAVAPAAPIAATPAAPATAPLVASRLSGSGGRSSAREQPAPEAVPGREGGRSSARERPALEPAPLAPFGDRSPAALAPAPAPSPASRALANPHDVESDEEDRGPAKREDAKPLRGAPDPEPPQSCCKKCCVVS